MALRKFDARNLKFIDGGAFVEQFDSHVERQVSDCKGRPADVRPRKITMEIELVPIVAGNGKLKTIDAKFKVASKSPHHQSDTVQLGIDADGEAIFNEHCMSAVDQSSFLPDGEDD